MEYGLVGESLIHSYSKIIHEKFSMYEYNLHSVSFVELEKILKEKRFKGLNVTMPYKKTVIPFCDKLDITAQKIGSVNTLVVDKNGKLIGYNTDYNGLTYAIKRSKISLKNKKVLILGSGGTSSTAKVVASDLGAKEILVVSSKGSLNYKNVYEHKDADIIINTTPVGMYPNNGESLIDVNKFDYLSGVIDVIYNPFYTKLLIDAKNKGVLVAGGLAMLVSQAKASAEIFTDKAIDDLIIEKIIKQMMNQMSNIVIIGMPGCGKTTVSREIASKVNKKFVDTDTEIEKMCGMSVPEIFRKYGENEFRKLESEVLKNIGKNNSQVISTGGGIVLDGSNYFPLKQNSRIYFIKRDLKNLVIEGRPLSKSRESLNKMYEQRKEFYKKFSDKIIENNGMLKNTVDSIVEDFYENICY